MPEQLSKRDHFKTGVNLINSCSENFEWDIMRTVFVVTEALRVFGIAFSNCLPTLRF